MRGTLILIEGLDRSGKSTQAEILAKKLDADLVKFPDRSTPIGQIINRYLTDKTFDLPDQSAHLLFSANRWELAKSLEEKLLSGKSIVMDRYIYSGIAYSLAKKGAEMDSYDWLYGPDRGLPKPDLTFFLTISLEELSSRKGYGRNKKVKECFLNILDSTDPAIAIVDVQGLQIEPVTAKLWSEVESRALHQPIDREISHFS
ncbi:thymidylate kinase [Candidozyma duobushaemuli]|uniref:dTMP kinase n=1 Tax=Candidozyma duobushaemuli TaxID=1231522 RepID=A0A2V1ABN0_9ASCO|nr:thymidylate kinase [[Candida] duobushaemulonis]PVH15480.1 thymidylate kinase [[Candida] duobushaemulonis]